MAPVPEIVFNPNGHGYSRKDTGAAVPSLTRMLQDAGFFDINTWGPENIARGKLVHECVSKSLQRAYAMPAAISRTYVRQFQRFCKYQKFVPEISERIFYNDVLGYACRVDLMGHFDYMNMLGAKFPAIIEIKVDDEPHAAGLQLAGQHLAAVRNRMISPMARRATLRLTTMDFEYTDLTDDTFIDLFRAFLAEREIILEKKEASRK